MSWKGLSPFQVKWKLHNSLHSYCQSQTGEKVKKKHFAKIILTLWIHLEMPSSLWQVSIIPHTDTHFTKTEDWYWRGDGRKKMLNPPRKKQQPLTSPYWLSIRITRSVRLKMSRQSKSGTSSGRSSGGPLCRKLRMCLEEKGAISRLRSMKSITEGLRMVSWNERKKGHHTYLTIFSPLTAARTFSFSFLRRCCQVTSRNTIILPRQEQRMQ